MGVRAAVLQAPGQIAVQTVPDDVPPDSHNVLLRVGGVGLCGSDLLRYAEGTAYHYPIILGHEFSGVVEEAPAGSAIKPGTKVAVFPLVPRPDDPMTELGEWALGEGYDYFGSRRDGALRERMWVPERNLVPLPSSMPLVTAAAVEPVAVALHGVAKLVPPPFGSVLVMGAGAIGAFAAQWLRLLGWTRVVVADVDPRKREVVAGLGFEVAQSAKQALELAGGFDAAVEATGVPSCLIDCLEAPRPRGQVLILGDLKGDVTLPRALVSSLIRRELVVRGSWNSRVVPAGRSEWDRAVAAIASGEMAVDPIISQVAALEDAPEVFAAMAARTRWFNKIVFAVGAQARAETPPNWHTSTQPHPNGRNES